jgi:carbamate kinase
MEILQIDAVRTLLEHAPDVLPIACGGGGVPVARVPANPQTLQGVEAVIDKVRSLTCVCRDSETSTRKHAPNDEHKLMVCRVSHVQTLMYNPAGQDACGAKLATELDADGFIILTDGGGIWENFGKPEAREMMEATPEYLKGTKAGQKFPGSMGPKVNALIAFVEGSKKPGAWAAVGDLRDAAKIVAGEEGTYVRKTVTDGVQWRPGKTGPPRKESKSPPPF